MFSTREARCNGQPHLGIGLYVVRLIAERLGGKVQAGTGADARGPEFTIELPIATDSEAEWASRGPDSR
jgi:K+-sensing histidine kinase KdpD